jgi:formamidopyrimidine-DNA glycosylase
MPEGHVTHRLAIGLTERFAGTPTRSSSPQGRFAPEATEIDGHPLDFAEAYGKNLFAHFGERTVHVHLGLAGKWYMVADDRAGAARPVVGTIRWRLENDLHYADLRGPQACALVSADRQAEITAALGPDPLRQDADPEIAWQRIAVSKMPIALLLMDQRVSAGVGNIFRAEVLYRHRLDPMMQGRLLRPAEWHAIWDDLVTLMSSAVARGRIDSVRPEHEPVAMGRAPRVDRHGGEVYVYRRADLPCLVCGTRVRTAELGGRNLFWCPKCQRPSRRRLPATPVPRAGRARRPAVPDPVSVARPTVHP